MSDLPVVAQDRRGDRAVAGRLIHAASTELSGYDARTIYGLKARILYHAGTVRSEDFLDINRLNFNPGYPLLFPLLEAQMDWARGSDEGPGMKFLFLGFGLALVSIYARQARRFEGPGFTATTAAAVADDADRRLLLRGGGAVRLGRSAIGRVAVRRRAGIVAMAASARLGARRPARGCSRAPPR